MTYCARLGYLDDLLGADDICDLVTLWDVDSRYLHDLLRVDIKSLTHMYYQRI